MVGGGGDKNRVLKGIKTNWYKQRTYVNKWGGGGQANLFQGN